MIQTIRLACLALILTTGQAKADQKQDDTVKTKTPPPSASLSPAPQRKPSAPLARRIPKIIKQVGRERTDDYAWLKDENWQKVLKDPGLLRQDIREYLEAENAYTEAHFSGPAKKLQETLFREMKGRIKEDDSTVPLPDGSYAYYRRYRKGGQYPILGRKKWDAEQRQVTGTEDILFDGDKESEGRDYFSLGGIDHSPDHRYLAYAVDKKGSEYYDLRIRDLKTGKDLPDHIKNNSGDFVWAGDSKTLFWVWRNENGRTEKVYAHHLGETQEKDRLIYEESDPGFFVSLGKTSSGHFLTIQANDHTTSEIRLIPANKPETAPVLVSPRETGLEYSLEDIGDRFYILTNADGAQDFKIMTAPLDKPSRKEWRDFTPHRPGTLVLGLDAYDGRLIRFERENALPRLVIHDLTTDKEDSIDFEEEAYNLGLKGHYEFKTPFMRFSYASPTTPDQVFEYNMATQERRLLKTRDVPSGHIPSDYITQRLFLPARDGAEIPVTLLYHKDTPLDGSAPVLLYGYGSYGVTIPAYFSTSRLSLVDRGFIYAIAHIRGGMAKGYGWYTDGKLKKKQNTFGDFISAGHGLVEKGYTQKGRLIAMGGSAGGLLVGAVVNQAPDLFAGAIAAVPFVDTLNTMSDESLPLTPPEWPEWGNPLKSAEDYDTIKAYSPYDNVKKTGLSGSFHHRGPDRSTGDLLGTSQMGRQTSNSSYRHSPCLPQN